MPGLYRVFGGLNSSPHDCPPRWLRVIYPGPHFHLFWEISSLPLTLIFIWIIGFLICRLFFSQILFLCWISHSYHDLFSKHCWVVCIHLNLIQLHYIHCKEFFLNHFTSVFFFLWGLVLDSYYAQLSFNHFSCDFLVRLQYQCIWLIRYCCPFISDNHRGSFLWKCASRHQFGKLCRL